MKIQQQNLLAPLSEETMKELTTEVKEVLATGFVKNNPRLFSSAELWNIQRQRKMRVQRRYH